MGGYGFSNNVKGGFWPPKFKRAKFSLNRDTTVLEIKLRN